MEQAITAVSDASNGPDEDVRRLAALSDGVVAIAMTLLVLDLAKPDAAAVFTPGELQHLLAQWNAYAAFVLSFVVISIYWYAHFRTFRRLRHVDGPVIVANLVFLLGITFIPFPTAVLERFGSDRVAVMLYAGTLSAIGFVWAFLYFHTAGHGLLNGPRTGLAMALDVLDAPVIFLISIGIAWFSPHLAMYSWALMFASGPLSAWLERRRESNQRPAASTRNGA